jgi:Tol biopolymer transport system component
MGHLGGDNPGASARRARVGGRGGRRQQDRHRAAPVRRSWGLVVAAAAVAALGLVLSPSVAEAAFPGTDGAVVFASGSTHAAHFCGGWDDAFQLFELPFGAQNPIQLTCTNGFDLHPFVSPDGSEVVFSNIGFRGGSQLYTLPLPTSGSSSNGWHHHTRPTLVSESPQASDDNASWSPAGDGTIVFQRTLPGQKTQLFTENVADPAGATPVFPAPTGFDDTEPVLDPSDSTLIVFVRDVGDHTHIFSYDTTTQSLTDLSMQGGSSGNDSKPDFAPSGTNGRIVFESNRACGGWQLYTMTVQGTDQRPVFPSSSQGNSSQCRGEATNPAFSPQGDAIVFDARGHGDQQFAVAQSNWRGDGQGGQGDGQGGRGDGDRAGLYSVPVDSSGTATGRPTSIGGRDIFDATQPSWGPQASPPVQTAETALPVVLPVAGAVTGAAVLVVRRRRVRRAVLPTPG